jgi:hypothetical protein
MPPHRWHTGGNSRRASATNLRHGRPLLPFKISPEKSWFDAVSRQSLGYTVSTTEKKSSPSGSLLVVDLFLSIRCPF